MGWYILLPNIVHALITSLPKKASLARRTANLVIFSLHTRRSYFRLTSSGAMSLDLSISGKGHFCTGKRGVGVADDALLLLAGGCWGIDVSKDCSLARIVD